LATLNCFSGTIETMTRHNELLPPQPSARIKSGNKRMLRKQKIYKATIFFFVTYVAGMLIYAATLPDTLRIENSIRINSSAEEIFTLINDLHQWQAWSPWENNDITSKRSYSGAGKGAVYVWQANNDAIDGRMEIIESTPVATLAIKLDIIQTFDAHNTVSFTLVKQGDATLITQTVSGSISYASKLLSLCFDMNKISGDKYANGLARLKTLIEQHNPATADTHGFHRH
jgi:hypothetical protein